MYHSFGAALIFEVKIQAAYVGCTCCNAREDVFTAGAGQQPAHQMCRGLTFFGVMSSWRSLALKETGLQGCCQDPGWEAVALLGVPHQLELAKLKERSEASIAHGGVRGWDDAHHDGFSAQLEFCVRSSRPV